METKERRRRSKRYPVRWKAAVVFDKADGKPVLHTQTLDLSLGGAAIHSDFGDLTGSLVTLLLAYPPRQSGEVPKMLKIRARVVSTVQPSGKPGFRHGLSFVQPKSDGLDILAEILGAAEPDRASSEAPPAEVPAATPPASAKPSAPAAGSRLAQLKELALAKKLEGGKPNPQDEINARVSGALEKAYRYLTELTDQLNIVKPPYAKAYAIAGVPSFDGLTWQNGSVAFRSREISATAKLYEEVALRFHLSANKQLRVSRDNPAHEKLKQLLFDNKIDFTAREECNERGSVVRTTFVLPCEVKASLQLVGDFGTGKLLLKTRNVERFGVLDHLVAPSAITEASLEELSGFILGESSRIGPLLLKDA